VQSLTNAVKEAWKTYSSTLTQDERKTFESYACDGFNSYMRKLEDACREHRDKSRAFKILDWFDPIFKAVELFLPAAKIAVQAYPNPGSLVLGGIVGVVQITNRFKNFQKLAMQNLARMGRKARILQEYETTVYKSDFWVQAALIQVYGDMMAFCLKAFRLVSKNKKKMARVKGFRLLLIRDFEAQFGKEVEDFENHLEALEAHACLCDKKRLQELHNNLSEHNRAIGQVVAGNEEQRERIDELVTQLWKRDQELQRRAYALVS